MYVCLEYVFYFFLPAADVFNCVSHLYWVSSLINYKKNLYRVSSSVLGLHVINFLSTIFILMFWEVNHGVFICIFAFALFEFLLACSSCEEPNFLSVRHLALANRPPEASFFSIQLTERGFLSTSPLHLSLLDTQSFAWRPRIVSLQGVSGCSSLKLFFKYINKFRTTC